MVTARKYHCIGVNKSGSVCSSNATRGFYCKRHEPVYPKILIKQNKDGSISKRNKTVVKRIKSLMRRRKRFLLTCKAIEYSVHHSGQLYATQKRYQKNQPYNYIEEIIREAT